MSLSDLTPGEKLSLKGRLFELQKKLNLIGINEQMETEQGLTFQPNIETEYKPLEHRHDDFIKNVQKAEEIRKVIISHHFIELLHNANA